MNKVLHRFALLVACATFLLIIAGALVTSHDAGLATPDWPLSNGQVFPKMVGNLFWEHGHRLVATTVGILTIGLVFYLFLGELTRWLARLGLVIFEGRPYHGEPRRWVRLLGVAALGAVVGQGLLGGLTVKLMLPLAVFAAPYAFGPPFFLTLVRPFVFSSPGLAGVRKD